MRRPMSPFGPSQTFDLTSLMSAFEGKADMVATPIDGAF
jgi:hypothetical protein